MRRLAVLAAAALAAASPACAEEDVASFFAGKRLNLIIASSAGGGYDTYGRLLARHLGDHIPGKPSVIPTNMPGAGSKRAIEYMLQAAPRDGTALAAIFPGAILEPLLGEGETRQDPSKLIFLGSANSDVFLCVIRTDAPVQTFSDAFAKEVIVGASAEGGSSRDFPVLLNSVLGTHFRLVAGYPGSREMTLAIERGEVQGECGLGWSSINAQHPDWLKPQSKVRPLVQESIKARPEITAMGAPLAGDFAKTPEDRQILELVYSQEIFGRPYVLPPDVPPERVAALRKAFMDALADPALLAEAQTMHIDVIPISGDEVQALVVKAYATPPEVIARAKQALATKP